MAPQKKTPAPAMSPKRTPAPAKKTDDQGTTATKATEALTEIARPLQATSTRKNQNPNTPAEEPVAKRARLVESEQNADAAPSTLQQAHADPALPVPSALPCALRPEEMVQINQPAPAAESKPQEACNK